MLSGCTLFVSIKGNNTEILVDNSTARLCLQCLDFNEQYDTMTEWTVLYHGRITVVNNNGNMSGRVQVENGYVIFVEPYTQLVNNSFFTYCVGRNMFYKIDVYSTSELKEMVGVPVAILSVFYMYI